MRRQSDAWAQLAVALDSKNEVLLLTIVRGSNFISIKHILTLIYNAVCATLKRCIYNISDITQSPI